MKIIRLVKMTSYDNLTFTIPETKEEWDLWKHNECQAIKLINKLTNKKIDADEVIKEKKQKLTMLKIEKYFI